MTGPKQFQAKEWNAGGAFYFYGKMDRRSFIVEVETTEPIQGTLLQEAMDRTLKRMPYFGSTFVRKKSLFYYAENNLPLICAESDGPRRLGGEITNYHMLDVTYHDNIIRFAMFHGLTDGLGFNKYIESVLYHYFCLKDNKEYSAEGIVTEDTPYDPEEIFDPIAIETKVDPKGLKELADKDKRFRLPELSDPAGKGPLMYRLPLKIKTPDLIAWCKEAGTTPASAVSAMICQVINRENRIEEGLIMTVVPASLKRFLHADKSFKNCSSAYFIAAYPSECASMSTGELAKKLRTDLKNQMGEKMALLMSSSINMIVHLGKKLPTFFLKNKVMALPEKRPQDTVTVDYVGGLTTNDYSDQITGVKYLNADAYGGGLYIVMSETAGYFHINFTQTFESSKYYDGFLALLNELNIPYETMPRDTYLNPIVEIPAEQK